MAARPYAERMRATMAEVAGSRQEVEHPLLEAHPEPTRRELLVRLDSQRRVVTRQLALEAWLADWRRPPASAC